MGATGNVYLCTSTWEINLYSAFKKVVTNKKNVVKYIHPLCTKYILYTFTLIMNYFLIIKT